MTDSSGSVRSVYEDGRTVWHNAAGKLHRLDGPAMYIPDSFENRWYFEGQLHRDGGPAVYLDEDARTPDSAAEWYQHGRRHRLDGPARMTAKYIWWFVRGDAVDAGGVGTLNYLFRHGLTQDLEQTLSLWRPGGPTPFDLLQLYRSLGREDDLVVEHVLAVWQPGGPTPLELLDPVRAALL